MMMPNIRAMEKANRAGPPSTASAASTMTAVMPVMMVRDSVSLTDRSMMSRSGMVLYLRRFSRRRSNTTTVSFIE